MNPLHLIIPSSGPDSLELHVPTGEVVGLALKVHLAQAKGTLLMGEEVFARHASR